MKEGVASSAGLKYYLRTRFPALSRIYTQRKSEIRKTSSLLKSWLLFKQAFLFRRPYFGDFIPNGFPCDRERTLLVRGLVEQECKGRQTPFKILEIGSWIGASAVLFARALRDFNSGNGVVFSVDPYLPYATLDINQIAYKKMARLMKRGIIFRLFKHNLKTAKVNQIVKHLKYTSDEILPTLDAEDFDLIYIDGDHEYKSVAKDLKHASRLVRLGGILCGDDLELQTSEINLENAKSNIHQDFILDPTTRKHFHPGVTLAVDEFFGKKISTAESFWAVRKTKNGWENIKLLNRQGSGDEMHSSNS